MKNPTELRHELKSLIKGNIKDIKRFDEILIEIDDIMFKEGEKSLREKIEDIL